MRDALRRVLATLVALAFLGGAVERAMSLPCLTVGGMMCGGMMGKRGMDGPTA